jgi:hypothetical protein
LQLLSAMWRDPVGMKYANLLESETLSAPPQDAYMRVLEAAEVLHQRCVFEALAALSGLLIYQ